MAVPGLLFLAPALGWAQGGAPAAVLVGCYELEIGPWERGAYPGPFTGPPESPPDTFRLLSERDPQRPGSNRDVFRVEPTWPGPTSGASWERIGADSLAISWGTGFTGVTLRLHDRVGHLEGVAEAWSDAAFIDAQGQVIMPKAPATARRIPCESSLDGL